MFDTENKDKYEEAAGVVLAALETDDDGNLEHRLEEMESLVKACNMEVSLTVTQKLPHPEPGTYIGKGKAEEIALALEALDGSGPKIGLCVFEGNLSPVQLKNLTRILKIEVWDRTTLILEIFSRRARTREARLQVESAYLQYMLPRLSGMWQHLGRQSGGGGSRANKGIGEKQIELDRRQIKNRIGALSRELEVIKKTRNVQRTGRDKSDVPRVALVGYTNAGKSTLMNRFLARQGADSEKQVFEENMLFATLDTQIRRITTEGHRDFLLSDTVGFIENLPHGLIKAFRSTLEEAASADLILVVLDASDEFHEEHRKVTLTTLKELSAETIPRLYVMNKADLISDRSWSIPRVKGDEIWMSAKSGTGMDELTEMITDTLYRNNRIVTLKIPYSEGSLSNLLHSRAHIISEKYEHDGIVMTADCPENLLGRLTHLLMSDTIFSE